MIYIGITGMDIFGYIVDPGKGNCNGLAWAGRGSYTGRVLGNSPKTSGGSDSNAACALAGCVCVWNAMVRPHLAAPVGCCSSDVHQRRHQRSNDASLAAHHADVISTGSGSQPAGRDRLLRPLRASSGRSDSGQLERGTLSACRDRPKRRTSHHSVVRGSRRSCTPANFALCR